MSDFEILETSGEIELRLYYDADCESPCAGRWQSLPDGLEAINTDDRYISPLPGNIAEYAAKIERDYMGDITAYLVHEEGYFADEDLDLSTDDIDLRDEREARKQAIIDEIVEGGVCYDGYLFYYLPIATVGSEWGGNREAALKYLQSVDAEYHAWADGECYGYTIVNRVTDDEIEACWGFIGYASASDEARRAFVEYMKESQKEK